MRIYDNNLEDFIRKVKNVRVWTFDWVDTLFKEKKNFYDVLHGYRVSRWSEAALEKGIVSEQQLEDAVAVQTNKGVPSPRSVAQKSLFASRKKHLHSNTEVMREVGLNWAQMRLTIDALEHIEPHYEASQLITDMKEYGYKLALFTNVCSGESGDPGGLEKVMEAAGFNIDQFDYFITGDDISGKEKPDPFGYKLLEKRTGCTGEHIGFVSDGLIKDLETASSLGWITIYLKGKNYELDKGLLPNVELLGDVERLRTLVLPDDGEQLAWSPRSILLETPSGEKYINFNQLKR